MTVPERLEDRALPGGSLLEVLLGVPLAEPFLGSVWADGNPLGSKGLPEVNARRREHLAALEGLQRDRLLADELFVEVRRLVDIAGATRTTADAYVDVARTRLLGVAGSLAASDAAVLASHDFLADLWWTDELLTSLARGRGLGTPRFLAELPVEGDDPEGMTMLGYGGYGNMPPVAYDDSYYTKHDTTRSVSPPGVMSNDYDYDYDPITAILVSGPSHASSFTLSSNGTFSYTPAYHYVGVDTFTYKVNDGIANSNTATVPVTVYNNPPVANNDYYVAQEGTPLEVNPPGVLGNDSDPDGDAPLTAVLQSGPTHGSLEYFHADGSFKYLPDVNYYGDVTFTYFANDGVANSVAPATVTIDDPPKIDLDAETILHNVPVGRLADSQEDYPGAYVPLNNDDDDYDSANAADKDQSGAIVGESDLLPIVMHAVEPVTSGGSYRLHVPGNVRVWRNADRTNQVADSTVFDATSDTTLYVEGVSAGAGIFYVDWWNAFDTINVADTVAVTVFQWEGPLNVAGHSVYKYRTTGGLEGGGNSAWLAPVGGAIFASSPGDAVDEVDILWAGGPVVGKAVYQAAANYIWDREVNVVRVAIGAQGNHGDSYPEPYQTFVPWGHVIRASNDQGGDAMTAGLYLDTVQGPVVNGAPRGKKFLEIGLSQQGRLNAKHADFNHLTPPQRVRSSVEDGQIHWDVDNEADIPWINTGSDEYYLNITSDSQNVDNWSFFTTDNPRLAATDRDELTGDKVDFYSIVGDYWDYLIVHTKDPRVIDPVDVFTQRARLHWSFNGSGDIDAGGVWHKVAATGVTVDPSFAEVSDGTRLPSATGNLNTLTATESWIVENK